MSFDFKTEVIEGFMGAEIPIIEFNDGTVKFWIPRWEWERVRDALSESIEEYPLD